MSPSLSQWLAKNGVVNQSHFYINPDRSQLITEAIVRDEGMLTHEGALAVITTPYTGRSPDDKYIVDHNQRKDLWWGEINQRISPEKFIHLKNRISAYLNNRDLFVIDCFIGADPEYRLSIRVITEFAWQALAIQNLFLYDGSQHTNEPDLTIFAAPNFNTDPEIDGVRSKAAICIDLKNKVVLVAGSKYVGEIKKSAFTVMNALLPTSDVLPMHCSANIGKKGDVALYFGLSGTGKTTLSSTPDRQLIGDDEHGWGKNGIFNFEGGCYAKTIRLQPDLEPVIWNATNQYGTILENVYINPENHKVDFDDTRFTENTRAAYSLSRIENVIQQGMGGHPENVFFLTADAFGVMPPIAKLNHQQAIYYFLSGYTSKVAGTERGLGKMPIATFSTCFGEPFLPLTPGIYADLLKRKLNEHGSHIWLVNTGWTGGDYNSGYRMPLRHTRRMIQWILSGENQTTTFHKDSIFSIQVPDKIEGVPDDLLHPMRTWKDKNRFREVAESLLQDFENNSIKFSTYLD